MADDQNQTGRAIVHDRGSLGLAQDREGALKVGTSAAAIAGPEIELYIIISGSDLTEDFANALGKWGAAEIGVNDDSGSVDDRLNPAGLKPLNCGPDTIDNWAELGNVAHLAQSGQLTPHHVDN
jgi:hypothetical protein